MGFEYKEYYHYNTSLCLAVTEDCNLACKYCFVKQQPKYMTFEIAKKAVDQLVYNIRKCETDFKDELVLDNYMIYFFGGEPLLCFDSVIRPIVNYCKVKYADIPFTFGVTTNGTLLTEKSIEFFKNYNFSMQVSIDGNYNTQNNNRPLKNNKIENSFDLLYKKIQLLKKYQLYPCYRGTITQEEVSHLFDNYLFFEKEQINPILLQPELKLIWTDEQIFELINQLEKIFIYRIWEFDHNIIPLCYMNIDRIYNDIMWIDFIKTYPEYNIYTLEKKVSDICGTGAGGTLTVDPEGKVYGCQERPSYKYKAQDLFLIGDNCKINPDRQKKLFETVYNDFKQNDGYIIENNNNLLTCNDCFLKDICKIRFGCISSGFERGKANIRPLITCIYQNELMKNAMSELELLSKINKIELLDKCLQMSCRNYNWLQNNVSENCNKRGET